MLFKESLKLSMRVSALEISEASFVIRNSSCVTYSCRLVSASELSESVEPLELHGIEKMK